MILRSNYLIILMACFSFGILNMSVMNSAYAQPKADSNKMQGKVIDIINVTSYTYAEINTGTDKVWVAGPTTALKVGDTVTFSTQMPMKDFYSESMKRNFSTIYFISSFATDTEVGNPVLEHEGNVHIKQLRKSLKGVDTIDGGKNIAEIHAEKDNLNGKTIRVRGQVTRFATEIMGKNWLHIQDSSSFDDLTVTTDNTVAIGDVVVIEGKLEVDKDFDYGYLYPVIVQNAKVTKE